MYLKKIKIKGFKSFAKPVEIDIESPLTAVVGPNGSGKSNIVDAIRWALGEQSAKSLRGSRMADVIFAGSDDHHPLKKASVTLFINNEDGILPLDEDEVIICRRVSQDGQSDYLLNGSTCRLKDIEELLLDTGLGKDAYSIVGQGRIDSIINSKPEKLRELFEEAAGISKHKMRKEEAVKRLGKTNQDLQRVNDLIWELKKQVKPLKKAADKARKYKRIKGELAELEISLLLAKWDKYHEDLDHLRKDKEIVDIKLNHLLQQEDKKRNKLNSLEKELHQQENSLEETQQQFYQYKTKRDEANNNLNIIAEREKSLKRERTNLEKQFTEIETSIEELINRKEKLSKKKINLNQEENKFKGLIEAKENILQEKKEELHHQKKELYNLRNSILNDNVVIKDMNREMEQAEERSERLEREIEQLASRQKEVSNEINENLFRQKDLVNEIKKISEDTNTYHGELEKLRKAKEEKEYELRQQKEKYDKINQQLHKQKSHLRVLKEMEEEYEGYYRGVKSILQATHLSGITGVVADCIEVEEKYETAIETALGSRLQNIIVENDEHARKAVEFLKEERKGRATFLPLNMVKGRKFNPGKKDLSQIDGYLGFAVDFVDFKPRLESLMNYLLGRVIVASTLKAATDIAKLLKSRVKIVTLKGDIINPGGAITGGSRKKNSRGLLGRSRQIENLKKGITVNKKEIKDIIINAKKLEEEINKLGNKVQENQEYIQELELRKKDLTRELTNLKQEENKLTKNQNGLDDKFVDLHNRLGEVDSRKQELKQKLELINNEFSREKDSIQNKEKAINQLEEILEEIKEELTGLKVELATVGEKKAGIKSEINQIVIQLDTLDQKLSKNRKRDKEIEANLGSLQQRQEKMREMKEEYTDKITILDNKLKYEKDNLKRKREEVKILDKEIKGIAEKVKEYQDKEHSFELKITRLEDRIEQVEVRLQEEYDIRAGIDEVERIEIDNYKKANNKVREFKKAIKKLGTVNEGAVEEYEELTARLQYLEEQKADLEEAKDSILKVIAEIEKNMANLFYETFQEVKNEFENIFQSLFSGGKAELKLTNEDNLLETGVEIVAQPPGKQLKKLSLMSGGERALTAIALVFAFLQVNPSPLYILDEIDAPLDDANVLRFARFIKEYSKYVQFIIITHNKIMMSETDTIYGVTMEESGISKVVSLKLDEEIA